MVFANSSVFTQFNRFEPSEFEGLPTPVWVFDRQNRQVLWENRAALALENRDIWEALILPKWKAFVVLDSLGFWSDWEWLDPSVTAIAAWGVDGEELGLCWCSGILLEDQRHAVLMQVPSPGDSQMSVTIPMLNSRSYPKTEDHRLLKMADAMIHILALQNSPDALSQSLSILGKAMDFDRICLWKRSDCAVADRWTTYLRHEWTNQGIVGHGDIHGDRGGFSPAEMPPCHGIVSGFVCHASPPGTQSPLLQNRVFAAIPIAVGGECWGFLSVEERRSISTVATIPTESLWSERETSIFQAVAASIGSTIAAQQALEQLVRIENQLDCRVEERTLELTNALKQLSYNVHHDFLTGLPNRALLIEKLNRSIANLQENPRSSFAVLLLDLERFKVINDSLGHSSGDRLLVEVAHRLLNCVDSSNMVARLGGDEFAIVLKNIHQLSQVTDIAERITTELTRPFYINHQEVFTNVRIGIVLSSLQYNYAEEMLRDADIVAERAKLRGQSCFAIFDTAMHHGIAEKLRLENELRRAITALDRDVEEAQFQVVYQPIISLATDRIVGFEALLRWHHPELGSISPAQFIPVAEETGSIVRLGEWILFQACRQLRIWEQQMNSRLPLKISVNISGRQFSQTNLISQIDRILELTGVRGSNLKLEVTESAIMDNADSATKMLLQLKERQIQLCMDDFGTGYSSLSYLHRFPLDTLKIDRSFISPIKSFRDKSEILQTIVTLAHNLGMSVVAEGVETATQKKTLRSLGCEFAQGYLFSKPVDAQSASGLIVA
ncbi:MAG: EAL domain-containing protein [Geitlerinemataceae cyanobacterium]